MECACPQCGSKAYKRNGYTRHGKQNHRCLDCGRQFSHEPSNAYAGSGSPLDANHQHTVNEVETGIMA